MADTKTETKTDTGTERLRAAASAEEMLAEIQRDISALTKSLSAYGRARSATLSKELDQFSDSAMSEIGQLLGDLQHRIGRAERDIQKSVQAHPREWIGGVLGILGIGILMGLVFNRRG